MTNQPPHAPEPPDGGSWNGSASSAGQPGQPGPTGNPGQPGFQGSPGGPGPGPQDRSFDAYGNRIPSDARTMAVLSHLSTLVILLISAGWLSILGPLVFWFIYKDKPGYQFVRVSSAEAFNFNALVWIVNIAAWILVIVTFGVGIVIALPVWVVVNVVAFVCHIIGAVKANKGEIYRYPMKISILS
ncbi:DUF4870 domain-containing protein [Kocuria sp. TGY1127_2]|uniref:DUF4870 domain-containing protein n=1 Tax=Kocuria sp. TGY1127_2 TaxID=2711328 RepID=UPI0015B8BB02|nr:DUF4870 domain-containing protein [Kocuria sp. TGY1127_2]